MTEQTNLVPKRRFKEFQNTYAWEQHNLGNISIKIGSGKTPKGGEKNYKSEGIPLLRSQNIFNDKVNLNDVVYIAPEIDDDMANSRVQKGDVLLNITGASIGRSAVYELPYKANVNQHVSIIRPINEVTPHFIQLNITSDKGKKQIELNQAGGGREGLNFQQIAKMNFYFPSIEEQEKIGEFIVRLDNLITLQRQKLEKTKALKSAYLSEMFPAEGEREPKRRFAGFTKTWEQRELTDVADVIDGDRGKNYPSGDDFSEQGHTLFLSATNVTKDGFLFESNQYITEEKSNTLGNGKLELNDIVLTSRGSLGHVAWYNNDIKPLVPFARINSGMLILRSKGDVEPSYIEQYLKSPLGKRQIDLISFGSAQPQLTKKDVSNYTIFIPEKAEQAQLGVFFFNLDHLITLHQRKLEKLQNLKKAYLNEMFV